LSAQGVPHHVAPPHQRDQRLDFEPPDVVQ
jgi:hypothetical protein